MHLSALPFPEKLRDFLLAGGMTILNPPQALAVNAGLLEKKNLVIASPTASGKTFIAELAILRHFLDGGKTLYIVPLKALASEKYHEFTEKYEKIGLKVGVSVGDLDVSQHWLASYDVVILSNEKADSILRHNEEWITKTTLIVTDEVHMLHDASRGPTLEMVLTRLRMLTNAQILALSATISNADELASWLGATLVTSDYRPVSLRKGVFYRDADGARIDFVDHDPVTLTPQRIDHEVLLADDVLSQGKQSLVFVATRRSAESAAEKIGKHLVKRLSADEKRNLEALALKVLGALPHPTKQCKRLSAIVKNGSAFHHAGLVAKQRKLIEDHFRSGLLKSISSTTTLAYGLNLPAYRVIIRDVKRYGNYGMDFIPIMDVHQCMGRAGRPAYDTEGQAILIAKQEQEIELLKERYILSDSEKIFSKLSAEPMLRMHTLALVASGVVKNTTELESFYARTFFAHQYGSIQDVMEKVRRILLELQSYRFITMGDDTFISSEFKPAFTLGSETLSATPLGRRVSDLYLDPLSAHHIISHIKQQDDMGYLVLINECIEMRPLLRIRRTDALEEHLGNYVLDIPDAWDLDYEDFLMAFKTGLLFESWMNETSEDSIVEYFGTTPGELFQKVKNAERMLYASRELALLLNEKECARKLNKLRLRVKHGVKEELLRLVAIKGVGRARARKLYTAGIRTPQDITKAPIETLTRIVGEKIAKTIQGEVLGLRDARMRSVKGRR